MVESIRLLLVSIRGILLTAERDDELFNKFVPHDTRESWNNLKEELRERWLYLESPAEAYKFIDEETIDFGFDYDESKILSAFEKFDVGRIWAEFQVEPFLEVCEGEYLAINKATYLSSIEKPPSFSNLERLFVAEKSVSGSFDGLDRFFYLWAACPRCHYFAKLAEDDEYLPWDEDLAIEGCPACEGSGEWEFEI